MLYSDNVQKHNDNQTKSECKHQELNTNCSNDTCKEDNEMTEVCVADTNAGEDKKKEVVFSFSSTNELQFDDCLRNIIRNHKT